MDDIGALQNTVRRCTAVLVSAVGLATYAVSTHVVGLLLAVGGFGYVWLSLDTTSDGPSGSEAD